jgi:hypothetical protein
MGMSSKLILVSDEDVLSLLTGAAFMRMLRKR